MLEIAPVAVQNKNGRGGYYGLVAKDLCIHHDYLR